MTLVAYGLKTKRYSAKKMLTGEMFYRVYNTDS